jgi:hypothetical protein
VIGGKLRERYAAAVELEAAVKRVAALFAKVTADRGVRGDWPFPSPPGGGWSDDQMIGTNVLTLMHSEARASGGPVDLFPSTFWPVLARARGMDDLAARVAAHHERLLQSLRSMELPDPKSENDDQQESEAA